MTSQNKYKRRQQKRQLKKEKFYQRLGTYDDVFTYDHLYDAFSLCKQGVLWKASIQSYQSMKARNTYLIYNDLKNRVYQSKGFTEFDLMERGKLRHIRSVHISERCVQRTLCDHYLTPIVTRYIIYDNGASMKNKGTHFTLKRLETHLYRFYRKYKTNEGYILLYDFSDYFNSINHEKLYEILDKAIKDEDLKILAHHFIDCFGEKGLGLGSQISQLAAILFATPIDRMFKEQYHQKYYARYMDDGYCIVKTKEEANILKKDLFNICSELNLKINEKKVKIRKLSGYFTFLKKNWALTKTGKVHKKLCRKNIVSERRKLKKLGKMLKIKKIDYDQYRASYQSWRQNALKYDNYWAIKSIDKIYNKYVWAGVFEQNTPVFYLQF